jgi:periplasmic divalent cation tolerance protein
VTCASDDEAEKLSNGLVNKGLAACVNIADVKSVFEWKGKIEKESERLLIIKSIRSNFEMIEKHIRANHSYECPEIIAMEVTAASEKYASWVRSACLPGKNIEDSEE